MNEKQFFTLLKSVLDAGLTARSVADVSVVQGYQPRIQGAPDGMALLLWKINLHPFGYPSVKDTWTLDAPARMTHTEKQPYEITVQVQGSVKQLPAPKALLPYTAGDLCKIAGRILQSVAGLDALRAGGVGVQRLMQMPQNYFKDESDAFAQSPFFTLVFTFTDVEVTEVPIVVDTVLEIIPV
jgi:hypothetical protein